MRKNLFIVLWAAFILTATAAHAVVHEYELKALEPIKNRVGYPYVWMPPDTPQYRLTEALERLRVLNHQYNHLLLAKKRVSELLNWGTRMPVLRVVSISKNPEQTVTQLKRWWTKDTRTSAFELKPYRSWEASLARYINHYETYLEYNRDRQLDPTLIEKKLTAAKELREDEGIMTRAIKAIIITEHDKDYLLRLTADTFQHLYKIVGSSQTAGDDDLYAYYSLQEAAGEGGGTFTAYIDASALAQTDGAIIRIGRSTSKQEGYPIKRLDTDQLQVTGISIGPNDTFASISVPRAGSLTPVSTKVEGQGSVYRYEIKAPKNEQRLDYLFVVNYDNATASALVEVRKKSTIIDTSKNRLLERAIVPIRRAYKPAPASQTYEEVIYTGSQELVNSFSVTVSLSKPDSGNSVNVSVMPIYEPALTLIRSAGSIKPHTVAQPSNGSEKPSLWVFAIVGVLAIAAFLKRNLIGRLAISISRRLAAYYLFIAIIFMVIDIFLIQSFTEIYLFAALFWILFNLLASPRPSITIKAGGAVFAFALLFKFVNSALTAEKLSRWVIIFLVWSAIYLFIRSNRRKVDEVSLRQYLLVSKSPFVASWARRIQTVWRAPRIRRPQTIATAAATLIVSCLIYIGGTRYLASVYKKPSIHKFEPSIVYQSNIIILNGRGFGDNKNKRARIMTDFGSVPFDSWTDTKITFVVSDTLPNESINIWIEKEGTVSNKVPIRIISSTNGWDEQDEEYFNQLEHLSDETLRLNKYR
jgi:hypothetical protein